MTNDTKTQWARAPKCFACGKEMGSNPADVMYVGYGHRADGEGPGWVASVCACESVDHDDQEPSPCAEVAQAFAAEDGAEMSPEEYQRWLTGA